MNVELILLASEPNARGDLLTRLAGDLFHSLGYENCQFNVAKTGREIDVVATHRYENSRLVAECKATAEKIGGADINKFAGVLDAERRRCEETIAGYFVSLNGFKDSAVVQEQEIKPSRLILIDGAKVANEITRAGIVVPVNRAVQCAARIAQRQGLIGNVGSDALLVGYKSGWVWALFLEHQHVRTHVCILHADGAPLAQELCLTIQTKAEQHHQDLATLPTLNDMDAEKYPNAEVVQRRYFQHLLAEYGEITLEGMPADHEVGSQQFKLEDLYVGLQLIDTQEEGLERRNHPLERSIGHVLSSHRCIAILGPPGAGKTTTLKRLAIAYADPRRKENIDDGLPNEKWFPLVLRCRQLSDRAGLPIMDLIGDLAGRAEMPELRQAFQNLIRVTLRRGNLLLLVDGLDEIPDPSKRQTFVAQLRTFLATYPQARLVLTSRETGYRYVATSVMSVCRPFKVAPLSKYAIEKLTIHWHRHVIGDSPVVERAAIELSRSIIASDRVFRLATNPLLLTTLLLVRRWVGQLPRRRSVLYSKAIEVLLMTWNVEGHAPIEQDEAVPQLAYAAYRMMASGKSNVSSRQLAEYFADARRDLPEMLSYTALSVSDFLRRVEERSSLLTLSGYAIEDGELREMYEFKHLTFQEYLAATAIANGYLPPNLAEASILEVLEDRFYSDDWREVVALTAVLARRGGSAIVQNLVKLIENLEEDVSNSKDRSRQVPYESLVACLEDEVAIAPPLVREALERCIRFSRGPRNLSHACFGGRYENELYEVVTTGLRQLDKYAASCGSELGSLMEMRLKAQFGDETAVAQSLLERLESENEVSHLEVAAYLMKSAFLASRVSRTRRSARPFAYSEIVRKVAERIIRCDDLSPTLLFMYLWSMCWAISVVNLEPDLLMDLKKKAFEIWRTARSKYLSREASWLLWTGPITDRWIIEGEAFEADLIVGFLNSELQSIHYRPIDRQRAAMIAGYYTGVWSEEELTALLSAHIERQENLRGKDLEFYINLLERLGSQGLEVAKPLKERLHADQSSRGVRHVTRNTEV
ncbi:NACHT domain-containing protein [Streptosporangium sp. NPDC000095]|uniref:NACHT domain-containing protein n=1 Tax=Streptosporangium sp. NPDC000095 TaxID=3366184 RepID=UPI0036C40BF9